MRKLVAVCAQCNKELVISDDVSNANTDRLKELITTHFKDWRPVSINFGNQGGKAEAEVCSFECSMKWIDAQREAQYRNWKALTTGRG